MSPRQTRINWLLQNQARWEGYPWSDGLRDFDREKALIAEMKTAGVVSQKTNWRDVNLWNLIRQARKQRRTALVNA